MDEQVKRYYITMGLAAQYTAMQWADTRLKPEIIVAGIPIYSVQREGHAASDEILKYRSIGGIFLAHQKGGNRTFKFDALIYGPSRLMLLGALQQLLRHGRQTGLPIDELSWDSYQKYTAKDVAVRQNAIGAYVDNWEQVMASYVPYHRTFPIITDSKIYTNMYLETLVSREDIRLGINCIEIRCAFREYYPPTDVEIKESGEGKKEKYYYETWIDPEKAIRLKRQDLSINFAWAVRKFAEFFLNREIHEKEEAKYVIEGAILGATCIPFFAYMRM